MNALFLVNREVYDTKISRVRFDQIKWLSKMPGVWLIATGPGWPDWSDSSSVMANVMRGRFDGKLPDVVITYDVAGLEDVSCLKVVQYNEADKPVKIREFVLGNKIDIVVFHHWNDMGWYSDFDSLGIKRIHIPHCADHTVYKDYGLDKDIDILVIGNLSSQHYPLRSRLASLASKWFAKRGYRVKVLPHPGFNLAKMREGTCVGEDYAKTINRAWLVFSCTGRWHSAFGKFSEVALSRSLMVSDLPDERHQFFDSSIVKVGSWMTDQQIIDIIEPLLDELPDRSKIRIMTDIAYKQALDTSTMEHYAANLYTSIIELLEIRQLNL